MNRRKEVRIALLIIVAIVILINILGSMFYIRADFTEDRSYTLDKSTKNLLNNLQDNVAITAYLSKGLQPEFDKLRQDFKNLLIEYREASGGQISFEIIDPNKDDKYEKRAADYGIHPLLISSIEKDEKIQKKAFLGAVLKQGEREEIIPYIESGGAMESALSLSIFKLQQIIKPKVGYITGHHETKIDQLDQFIEGISVQNDVHEISLSDSISLNQYKALVWIDPNKKVSIEDQKKVNDYLNKGGSLFIALNVVKSDMSAFLGMPNDMGMDWLLNKWNLYLKPNFLIDNQCNTIRMEQDNGNGGKYVSALKFPFYPIITRFGKAPMTTGLSRFMPEFPSTINYVEDSTLSVIPLIMSSTHSGVLDCPLLLDVQTKWDDKDFPSKGELISAFVQKKSQVSKEEQGKSGKGSIIIVSDADFIKNGNGEHKRKLNPDNINFAVNSIDFLTDDSGLISLRAKIPPVRIMEQIESNTRLFIKWINFLLPIVLIILYGIIRWTRNNKKRERRRKEQDYVD